MELLGVSEKNERTAEREGRDQNVKGLEYQIQLLGHLESNGKATIGFQIGIGLSDRVKGLEEDDSCFHT